MTEPYYQRHGVTVLAGDCLAVLRTMPDASVEAICTDPPYGLAEIRAGDVAQAVTAWCTGDREHIPARLTRGFMGREWDRFVPPPAVWDECLRVLKPGGYLACFAAPRTMDLMGLAIRLAGFEIGDALGQGLAAWVQGQGFPKSKNQLKPAWEPILLAQVPFKGSLASNTSAHGVGALNIGASHIERARFAEVTPYEPDTAGRWPPNVLLDELAAAELDIQSGTLTSGSNAVRRQEGSWFEHGGLGRAGDVQTTYGDFGGASRFFPVFRWEAKAPTAERPQVGGVQHPTVKPLGLIRWLTKLITPPGGTVLDPFAGSGTTGQAARAEGLQAVLVEREPDYLPLIKARLDARPRDPQTIAAAPVDHPLDLFDLLDGEAS